MVLVVIGLAASFVPGMPNYEIDPELVLPPRLYFAALESSALRIRDNLRSIGLLAVGLVLLRYGTEARSNAAWE